MKSNDKIKIYKLIGYPFLTLFAFVYFLFVTFPIEEFATKLRYYVENKHDLDINFGTVDIEPLSTVAAKNLKLSYYSSKDGHKITLPVKRVKASVSILSAIQKKIDVDLSAKLKKGKLETNFVLNKNKAKLDLNLKKASLGYLTLNLESPVGMSGSLGLKAKLSVNIKKLNTMKGKATLKLDKVRTDSSKLMGMKLPSISIGSAKIPVQISKGVAKIKNTKLKGSDLNLEIGGDIHLAPKNINDSRIAINLKFKPKKEFLNKLPQGSGSFLSLLPKEGDLYNIKVEGTLGRPKVANMNF